MKFISHRGNLSGVNIFTENYPHHIDKVINMGFDVEVDVWYKEEGFFLGHDSPQYKVSLEWIRERKNTLWCHCKNFESLQELLKINTINCFWHENDAVALTSMNNIWAYPGKQPIKNSIAVMPELFNDKLDECIGICSDYIQNYKTQYENSDRDRKIL